MGATQYDICERFFQEAFEDEPRFIGTGESSRIRAHFVGLSDDRLYPGLTSMDENFPLVLALTRDDGERFFLLNGDAGTQMQTSHQGDMRNALSRTRAYDRYPAIIVPFSTMETAGIIPETIEPREVLADGHVAEDHRSRRYDDIPPVYNTQAVKTHEPFQPDWRRAVAERGTCPVCTQSYCSGTERRPVEPDEDGWYRWTTHRHQMGASVFAADYVEAGERSHAVFLSAFDQGEGWGRLYFLAQLPADAADVWSVESALQALKPEEVEKAEADGTGVRRQGDMFFVPMEITDEFLGRLGVEIQVRNPRRVKTGNGAFQMVGLNRLWGTAHTAEFLAELPTGELLAKGTVEHRPEGMRAAEHRPLALMDQWHQVVRNTVPLQKGAQTITPRAWSVLGRVD